MKRYQQVTVLVEVDADTGRLQLLASNDAYLVVTVWDNTKPGKVIAVEAGRMILTATVECDVSEKARWFPPGSRVVAFERDGEWTAYPLRD